ncbi:STM4015 family protein [Actinomadura rudentiformis]|uniref:Leucine-rich repeat domain-containing protein n=1 Tax=Actinomadura rudentiformis TaxID=359158 RepID=A0A6H9Z0F3_9ACTN|nr:STM4015 family protein [Actinomadura rudentiformis]KAB2346466.1 leucine-rich repeat domain-containing protein [Actinomadura rudentiformis]
MAIDEHLSEFDGLPVFTFGFDTEGQLPDAAEVAWAVRGDWGELDGFPRLFEQFVAAVDTARVTSLIIGFWGYEEPVASRALVANADRFPALRALFLGDILDEEYHLSWIAQGDITPVIQAFPGLERLGVRGGGSSSYDLVLSPFRSEALKELRFESGGLPADVVRAVAASDLPNLEELVLWLGVQQYGGDAALDDLAPILAGERLPALRHLGLQNSEIQDEIAEALASAPVVAWLESLSVSMGTLTDQGVEALLSGQPLTHLKRLDMDYAFLSEPMLERARSAWAGVELLASDATREVEWSDEWDAGFYVAASE